MDFQTVSTYAGLISLAFTFIGAFYVMRSGIGKETSSAQASALTAIQSEVTTLRRRVSDSEREHIRCQQVIDTIASALKTRGMVVTIQGDLIHIEETKGNKRTFTTRIRKEVTEETEEEE